MENIIKETKDYGQFKTLKGNRVTSKDIIQALIRSFETHPQLMRARPLLVNDKFEVIDGQHRLEAAKKLNMAVYYVVVPGITITEARLLNALQKQWMLKDWVQSWAATGHKDYQTLLDVQEEYPLPLRVLSYYVGGRTTNTDQLKKGLFKAQSAELYQPKLEMLADMAPHCKWWNKEDFALAVYTVLKSTHYDHNQMLTRLEKVGQLPVAGSQMEYLRILEDVYNQGRPQLVRLG